MKQISRLLPLILLITGCKIVSNNDLNMPYICITFDDEYQSVYNNALPILNQYHFRATNYINTGLLSTEGKYDWGEVIQLEHEYGWETGGHTVHHITMTNYDIHEVEKEIQDDWQALRDHGVSNESFAIPAGTLAESHIPLILKYFNNIRTSNDLKLKKPIDPTYLGYFSYDSDFTPQDMIARIIRGVENNEDMIIIGFHKIAVEDEGYGANCPPEEFNEIMKWIYENNFRVVTVSEAIELLK